MNTLSMVLVEWTKRAAAIYSCFYTFTNILLFIGSPVPTAKWDSRGVSAVDLFIIRRWVGGEHAKLAQRDVVNTEIEEAGRVKLHFQFRRRGGLHKLGHTLKILQFLAQVVPV